MSEFSFRLPDLGEGIVESEITQWHVAVGDRVEEDQVLADVQTDKAVVEVESPVTGTVLALGCEAGEVLAVGAELVRFDTGESPGESQQGSRDESRDESRDDKNHPESPGHPTERPEPTTGASSAPQRDAPRSPRPHRAPPSDPAFQQVLASPSLRKRAREAGIDLRRVPGNGPGGRVTHRDFDAYREQDAPAAEAKPARDAVQEVKLSGLRRVIARKMELATRSIPHYSYIEEVDVTQLEALRLHLNAGRETDQPKLTLLPFIALAMVKTLPRFPHCNARFDEEAQLLRQYQAVHLGVATMTDGGLMVPVVRHCDGLDLWQAAAEIGRVSRAAREGRAAQEELSGSTVTITSLGALGGLATTPVINAPETAILGINKMQQRPVVRDGTIVVSTMMNLSASFDHRIVDGYDGAQWVQALKAVLENPGAIFV